MEKKFLLIGLLIFSTFSWAQENNQDVTATINMYSGRSPVKWVMEASELQELNAKIGDLIQTGSSSVPDWGYIVVTNEKKNPAFQYLQIYVYDDKVTATDMNGNKKYFLDVKNITSFLLDLGNKHDPNYKPAKFVTLPPGTPYIVVIPSSFEETVTQGEKVEKIFTVFSEGSGPLKGEIKVPVFASINKKTVDLPAVEGIEDYKISVDSSKEGELNGDIIISSNDPNASEVRLPLRITVIGKETTEPVNTTLPSKEENKNGNWAVYFLALISILAGIYIYYLNTRKKNRG